MCELFGISSADKIKCNEILQEFFSHGVDNPDGWGLAILYNNAVSLEKEPTSSITSSYLKNRLTEDIVTSNLFAHIRKASVGNIAYKNSHPFTLRDNFENLWTLAHNGTIFESAELSPFTQQQKGDTDSERILYYLVDQINAKQKEVHRELSPEERFAVADKVVQAITPKNKVNLLIYDGDLFYVHTNLKDTLYQCQKDQTLFVATKPLNQDHWEKVPMNVLSAYRSGELIYVGKNHGNEFINSEKT